MTNQNDLTITFEVKQSPVEVFNAINNVRVWWSGNIEGTTDKLGSEWTYRYQDIHYSKQKITKLAPNKNVTWHVIDSYISFVKDKEEWTGTDIVFDITKSDDKTLLTFTHKGLVPSIACYDKCAPAWDYYINDSLFKLITTGKGAPNIVEK
jgi:hypothetical protein